MELAESPDGLSSFRIRYDVLAIARPRVRSTRLSKQSLVKGPLVQRYESHPCVTAPYDVIQGVTHVRGASLTENSTDEDQRTLKQIMDQRDPLVSISALFVHNPWMFVFLFAFLVAMVVFLAVVYFDSR